MRKGRGSSRYFGIILDVFFIACACLLWWFPSFASTGGIIRDAEVEAALHCFLDPLFKMAGLNKDALRIYLVADPQLNAAALPGGVILINTGLIIRSNNASQVAGVLAHETGHIMGGHHARLEEAEEKGRIPLFMGAVLGGLVALGGKPDAGAALALGGLETAARSYFHYRQGEESNADQAAARLLDQLGWTSKGMVDFMKILEAQEFKADEKKDTYLRTHPLTAERINFFKNHWATSPYKDTQMGEDFEKGYRRMKAKLTAFIEPPDKVLSMLPKEASDIETNYMRAIAYYRTANLSEALPIVDRLINLEPKNPYFFELKGQMLFENGKVKEALPSYRTAVALDPDSPLLRVGLAQVLIEMQDPALIKEAIKELTYALSREADYPPAWRLLAVSYGRDNQIGMAALSIAEQALREGKPALAAAQAKRALELLPKGAPAWLRAQDIKSLKLPKKERAG